MKRFFSMAAIVLATSGAMAEEGGEALLTIGDVEQKFTLSPTSDFSGSPQFPSATITLAIPHEGNATDIIHVSLGFDVDIYSEDVSAPEARLLRRTGETTENRFCYDEAERGGLTVTLEEYSIEGDFMSLQGRFSCDFGTSENVGRDIELTDSLPISGEFRVTLERL
jgi:hypothetical protein